MQILLAEDDKIARELLCRMIASEALDVVTLAEDGEDAWRILNWPERKFDACIFDMCMPKLDGLDLLARIRASEKLKRVRVIFCTAAHDRATVQRALLLGVNYYITKPYSRSTILEKLRHIRPRLSEEDVFESEPVVCRRLGIDRETYRVMLKALVTDANKWCADLALAASPQDAQKLFIRGQGIKGSCLNLGAQPTAEQIAELEEAIRQSLAAAGQPPQATAE
jgi:DNA-binding response OmpR family regulator